MMVVVVMMMDDDGGGNNGGGDDDDGGDDGGGGNGCGIGICDCQTLSQDSGRFLFNRPGCSCVGGGDGGEVLGSDMNVITYKNEIDQSPPLPPLPPVLSPFPTSPTTPSCISSMSHVSHPPPSTQPFCQLFPSHPVPPSEAPLFVNKNKIINDNKNLKI
jgi:hypothetical protein